MTRVEAAFARTETIPVTSGLGLIGVVHAAKAQSPSLQDTNMG